MPIERDRAAGAVSIVIPVRNGAAYIAEAVGSALAQGSYVGEVIVIDDGSSDDTPAIVEAFADNRVKLLRTDPGFGAGVAAARNTGLAAVGGTQLLFLDGDDRLRPGAIEGLSALARRHPDAVAVYGDYDRIDAKGRMIGHRAWLRRRHKPSGDILGAILRGNFITNGIMLIRTAAMRELGGFRLGMRHAEDWHAWCRLAAMGPIVHGAGLQVLDYRVHAQSVTMHKLMALADFTPALDAIYADPALTGRFSAGELLGMRREAELQLRTYIACQAVRARRPRDIVRLVGAAIASHPRRAPRVLAMSAAAALGL